MNIALYHNLPSGGARRAMVEMVKGLVARGHSVDEYCPETADLSFMPLEKYVRKTVVLPLHLWGVAEKRVPLTTPYITAARLSIDLRTMTLVGQRAAKLINQKQYDVVFTHDCQLTLVPDLLRFLSQNSIHYFHVGTRGLATEKASGGSSDPGLLEGLKAVYYAPAHRVYPLLHQYKARRNLQAARLVLTNSNFACAELESAFDVASKVCYLGVDVSSFRPLSLPREGFVLSVGTVHYNKGYRFLIEALAKIPEGQRPRLVIAANSADGAELKVLESMATKLRVNLAVHGVSVEAEMVELYNRAAAFVYCPIREPWGLAAVEAMACGTPVVSVAEGGVTESVVDGETGLLADRDEEAFAQALSRVLTDPKLSARLGASGVARARTYFSWESTVDQIEKLFCDMANRNPTF